MWAAFSSTSPDMKATKAFLSMKKKDPEENKEEGKGRRKSGGTLTRENSEKDQKKEKLCKGAHSSSSKVRGATTSSPIRFTKGEDEEEVLLERPERGVLRLRASLMEMSSLL